MLSFKETLRLQVREREREVEGGGLQGESLCPHS